MTNLLKHGPKIENALLLKHNIGFEKYPDILPLKL